MNGHVLRAWSCTVRLLVADARALTPATADLTALLGLIDALASRFRADSALSRANANAGRPTPIPALLTDYVHVALEAAAVTGGAVDPTVGLTVRSIGYDRDISQIDADGPALTPSPPRTDWHDVRLDRAAGLLTVPLGTALDLGATAKAHTADLAARVLARRYSTAVLVEIGGDVAAAGDRAGGWRVRVAEREQQDGQIVALRHGGLATSTTTVRRWRRGGQPVHHIVDPRTGAPAQEVWRTVSVHSQSALAANTASTAAIVLGAEAATWLTKRQIAARLVHRDGHVQMTPGWPADVLPAVA
jgi:thiamine biosynthesis lipoprotein